MRLLALVLLAGCGRVGFGPAAASGDDGPAPDAGFPLPASQLCSATRFPLALGTSPDLVIQADGSDVTALVASPGGQVTALRIGAGLVAEAPRDFATGPVDAIAGAAVSGTTTLFTTSRGAQQTLWHLDGATLTMVAGESSLAAANGLVTDTTRAQFVWLRASGNQILTSFVTPAGVVGATGTIQRNQQIDAIAGADNDDHAHMLWTEGTACL